MKLVRDACPGTRTALNDDEFQLLIRLKLLEEAAEVTTARPTSLVEELGDLLEVFLALAEVNNVTLLQINRARRRKAQYRGAFRDRVVSG